MRDLTQGPIPRLLLNLAAGYLFNIAAGLLRTMAEVFWAGHLGAAALAALTLAANPLMIVVALAPVVAIGARVLIAQAVGAGDASRCARLFNESLSAATLLMAALGMAAWVFRARFANTTTHDTATAAQIVTYLAWAIPAVAIQVPTAVLSSALAASGNLRITVVAQTTGMVLHLAATPLLMFGWFGLPALGISGAGVAALICSCSTLVLLASRAGAAAHWLPLLPQVWFDRPRVLHEVVLVGLPVGVESALTGAYLTAVAFLLNPFGPVEQAAFGVGQRLVQLGTVPLMALSAAASIIAGQNFGARQAHRVRQTFRATLLLGLSIVPLPWLLCWIAPEWVAHGFSEDPAVIRACARYLSIASFMLGPGAVTFAALAVLSGMGRTVAGLAAATAHAVLVVLPALAFHLRGGLNPDRLWTLMAAASVLEMLIALLLLRRASLLPVPPEETLRVDPVPVAH